MKILVLGMPRTGTQSLADALAYLDISPVYHMREVGKNNHQALWIEALEAKFDGKGQPFNRAKFDQILDEFEALADYPAAIFPVELMAAYPEAVVILTTGANEDRWFNSMMATLWHQHTHRAADSPSAMAVLAGKYHDNCWGGDFPTLGRTAYRAHNELVREEAARTGRKFLEYGVGQGWRPLCDFLGVEVPDKPYPRTDDWMGYKKMVEEKKRKEADAGAQT
ncbi:uncharacterized protein BCR38DRAFT_93701 [Pseudomassariella vexata]|uniref:P-loop containing nucleoside triphosphate hydrolase protein n=1 Tax=Pseudomassariella vexata TaxID=1141098 RepID=A0A1Y2EE33_9PEZI|nr:uncharacterized protein BCR38DRAFT_93701 [Pseudomassariella vexata]ORY69830.1 hypothetical protein BCR38DRAFT_93701 [Pseudomassariella vexata]